MRGRADLGEVEVVEYTCLSESCDGGQVLAEEDGIGWRLV